MKYNTNVKLAVFVLVCLCVSGPACDGRADTIQMEHETIVGRAKDFVSESSQLSRLTFSLDAKELVRVDKDKVADVCRSVDRVKGVEFQGDDTMILSVDAHYVGSVEKVAEDVKTALKQKLGLDVIESRVIN